MIAEILLVAPVAAFLCGWAASHAWDTRRIDHRWYCGARHRACEPCQPSAAHLAFCEKWEREHPDRTPESILRLRRAWRALRGL